MFFGSLVWVILWVVAACCCLFVCCFSVFGRFDLLWLVEWILVWWLMFVWLLVFVAVLLCAFWVSVVIDYL